MNVPTRPQSDAQEPERVALDSVIIRFAGDSGDGMQLAGTQFTQSTALMGNDLATFPDYPAEIRAPAGTTYGVSAFQINFADHDVTTPGDAPDVLVAMNPAALIVNLEELQENGLIIVNSSAFTAGNLKKAGYTENPLENGSLAAYRVMAVDITAQTIKSVEPFALSKKEAQRSKNLWALGLMYWLYGRDRQPTVDWLKTKFKKHPAIADSNIAALNAGHIYGQVAELPSEVTPYRIDRATLPPGTYRNIQGSSAAAWGLIVGAKRAGLNLVLGSYPITPASSMLHTLAQLKHYGVVTFQAEDEIAAVCAAIGASFAGSLGVTTSSGPGLALKMEAIGLAVSVELPLVILNVQRGGPSTGLPTKTEQSDLLQMLYGRNGDSPLVIIAISSPSDSFLTCMEACRIAAHYMTPVIVLSDGYIANGSEPWRIPELDTLPMFPVGKRTDPEGFHPFLRNETTLERAWAVPGTPGLEHRIGGLEKDYDSGNISYDAANHQKMTDVRQDRIARIAYDIPLQDVASGQAGASLAVVGWGSTHGAIHQAVANANNRGYSVAHVHIRHIKPLPLNLKELLESFDQLLIPEMNTGQMASYLRSEFLIPTKSLSKVSGRPFTIAEIEEAIVDLLSKGKS